MNEHFNRNIIKYICGCGKNNCPIYESVCVNISPAGGGVVVYASSAQQPAPSIQPPVARRLRTQHGPRQILQCADSVQIVCRYYSVQIVCRTAYIKVCRYYCSGEELDIVTKMTEEYLLAWNDHHATFFSAMSELVSGKKKTRLKRLVRFSSFVWKRKLFSK